jgi:hypothetical protein
MASSATSVGHPGWPIVRGLRRSSDSAFLQQECDVVTGELTVAPIVSDGRSEGLCLAKGKFSGHFKWCIWPWRMPGVHRAGGGSGSCERHCGGGRVRGGPEECRPARPRRAPPLHPPPRSGVGWR